MVAAPFMDSQTDHAPLGALMTDDILAAADAAQRSFWLGSDKSKIELRQAMTDLRIAVHDEQKRRAQEDTTRIDRDARKKD
jgi:cytochrome b